MNRTLSIASPRAAKSPFRITASPVRLGACLSIVAAASLGLATPASAADEAPKPAGNETVKPANEPAKPAENATAKPVGEVVEFGTFKLMGRQRVVENANTPDRTERNGRGARFTSETDTIPAEIGQQFGFRFKITGLPETETVDLKTIVKHPPIKNDKGVTETEYTTTATLPVRDGVVSQVTGYSLDREEELAPGTWTFEHWYDGQKLVSQSFTVVAPN